MVLLPDTLLVLQLPQLPMLTVLLLDTVLLPQLPMLTVLLLDTVLLQDMVLLLDTLPMLTVLIACKHICAVADTCKHICAVADSLQAGMFRKILDNLKVSNWKTKKKSFYQNQGVYYC